MTHSKQCCVFSCSEGTLIVIVVVLEIIASVALFSFADAFSSVIFVSVIAFEEGVLIDAGMATSTESWGWLLDLIDVIFVWMVRNWKQSNNCCYYINW